MTIKLLGNDVRGLFPSLTFILVSYKVCVDEEKRKRRTVCWVSSCTTIRNGKPSWNYELIIQVGPANAKS